jgi:hypothetical protein
VAEKEGSSSQGNALHKALSGRMDGTSATHQRFDPFLSRSFTGYPRMRCKVSGGMVIGILRVEEWNVGRNGRKRKYGGAGSGVSPRVLRGTQQAPETRRQSSCVANE